MMRQQARRQTWINNVLYRQLIRIERLMGMLFLLNNRFPSRVLQMSGHICCIIVIGMLSSSCSVSIGRTWNDPLDWTVDGSVFIPLPLKSRLGQPTVEIEMGRMLAEGTTLVCVNGGVFLPPPFSSGVGEGWMWGSYVLGGAGLVEGQFTPNGGFGIWRTLGCTDTVSLCYLIRSDYRYFFYDDSPFNRVSLGLWFFPNYR